jgi:hypothetical protein
MCPTCWFSTATIFWPKDFNVHFYTYTSYLVGYRYPHMLVLSYTISCVVYNFFQLYNLSRFFYCCHYFHLFTLLFIHAFIHLFILSFICLYFLFHCFRYLSTVFNSRLFFIRKTAKYDVLHYIVRRIYKDVFATYFS